MSKDYGVTQGYATAIKSIIRETVKQRNDVEKAKIIQSLNLKEPTLEEIVEAKYIETMERHSNDPNMIDTGVKPTKLAIVGFAPNWDKAPFEDTDFEIWGLNELYKYFGNHEKARADRWFEIHNRKTPTKSVPEHTEWIKKCPMPVYMHEHYDDTPNSLPYPLKEVLQFVQDKGLTLDTITDGQVVSIQNKYATNSITWMILLGWMEGFKEIHIYGVDLACKEEYLYQRPNLEYYIGAMQRDGVKVVTPDTCDLLKASVLYGFADANKFRLKMKDRIEELKKRKPAIFAEIQKHNMKIQELQAKIGEFKAQIISIDASVSEDEFWLKNWVV